jgi:hypothetical protein
MTTDPGLNDSARFPWAFRPRRDLTVDSDDVIIADDDDVGAVDDIIAPLRTNLVTSGKLRPVSARIQRDQTSLKNHVKPRPSSAVGRVEMIKATRQRQDEDRADVAFFADRKRAPSQVQAHCFMKIYITH